MLPVRPLQVFTNFQPATSPPMRKQRCAPSSVNLQRSGLPHIGHGSSRVWLSQPFEVDTFMVYLLRARLFQARHLLVRGVLDVPDRLWAAIDSLAWQNGRCCDQNEPCPPPQVSRRTHSANVPR